MDLLLCPDPSSVAAIVQHIPDVYPVSPPLPPRGLEAWEGLIRWGEAGPVPRRPRWELNPSRALRRATDPQAVAAFLRLNGIPALLRGAEAPAWSGAWLRSPRARARLAICDLRPVWRSYRSARGVVRRYPESSRLRRRIELLARRALYCLDLDFGDVEVAVWSDGTKGGYRLALSALSPSPRLKSSAASRFGRLLAEAVSLLRQPWTSTRATLGADPEFLLRHRSSGRLLMASDYFRRRGAVGHDALPLQPGSRQYPIAEVRVPPDRDPYRLVYSLRRLLRAARRIVADAEVEWLAASQPSVGLCTGGHIHFGGVQPTSRILHSLDNYLAVPLLLCEEPRQAAFRRQRYGYPGDFRNKPYGGFEYRTPGSWLYSPRFALASLCLARLVLDGHRQLNGHWLESYEVQEAFYSADKHRLLPLLDSIWHDLTRLPGYADFREPLDWLYERARSGRAYSLDGDFRVRWRTRSRTR